MPPTEPKENSVEGLDKAIESGDELACVLDLGFRGIWMIDSLVLKVNMLGELGI